MSLIKTLAHDRILNFFAARDGAGSVLTSENGVTWTATAALGTSVENALIVNAEAAKKAVTSGNLQEPAATSDWALMLLVNFDAVAGTFGLGDAASNHSIEISIGGVSVIGTTGTASMASTGVAASTLYKILLTFDLDGDINLHYAEPGTDLSSTPNKTALASDSGAVTTFDDSMNFSSLLGNADVIFYCSQMVEFTNGSLETDVVAKADACMEAWYAGNKRHYEILEEDV